MITLPGGLILNQASLRLQLQYYCLFTERTEIRQGRTDLPAGPAMLTYVRHDRVR